MTVHYAVTYVPKADPVRDSVVTILKGTIPDLHIVTDPMRQGVWPTTLRAYELLLSIAEPGDHLVVLQDDMLPCNDFTAVVDRLVRARPMQAISMFSMRQVIEDAVRAGYSWVETKDGTWGGSMVLPMEWVRPWLDWCAEFIPVDFSHDDRRLAAWLLDVKDEPIFVTAPTVLQHIAPGDSLLGHSNSNRVSLAWDRESVADYENTEAYNGRSAVGEWIKDFRRLAPF